MYVDENGKIKGQGKYVDGDGGNKGVSGVPKNGREGQWMFYHENGQLKQEGEYENGEMHGEYKWYFENGQLDQEGK